MHACFNIKNKNIEQKQLSVQMYKANRCRQTTYDSQTQKASNALLLEITCALDKVDTLALNKR